MFNDYVHIDSYRNSQLIQNIGIWLLLADGRGDVSSSDVEVAQTLPSVEVRMLLTLTQACNYRLK